MDASAELLVLTIGLLTVYVLGVGGSTAGAIRIRERWRQRPVDPARLDPGPGRELKLSAPSLTAGLRRLRLAGWLAFPAALALAVFADRPYPWVAPAAVLLMVALNAFYFTAMQNMGEELTLSPDGFQIGAAGRTKKVRWAHVTEFTGARVGAFTAARMSDTDDWQDPRARPNVIFYRLNRALVTPRKTVLQRLLGFSYYDGIIRNAFGISTEQLLRALKNWHRVALESEDLPLRPKRARP
ncbi:MAG TPA: hypothetical protein VFL29_07570 [Candidatus Dormibacteraeota bacterium]|nr:hypothetical protein [Candidatus Dormibacteraeota bacterium]